MTTDHDKLRELAEAARRESVEPWYERDELFDALASFEDRAFIAAASPSTILSLLDALKAAAERAERAEPRLDAALQEVEDQRLEKEIAEKQRDEARAECVQERTRADELAGRALRAESERDEARAERDITAANGVKLLARVVRAESKLADALAERDVRPEITAEDASDFCSDKVPYEVFDAAHKRVCSALRAHARKAVKP